MIRIRISRVLWRFNFIFILEKDYNNEIESLTLEVLAEKALTFFDSKNLVKWAVNVLKTGVSSENLYILAGLDNDSTEDREEYFWKSINDLNLNFSKSEDDLIEIYAFNLAKKVVKNGIDIEIAFKKMLQIVSATGYSDRYIGFYEISEDLDYLYYDNSTIYNHGLTLENYTTFVLEEFNLFLEMEDLKIPIEERQKSYCLNCQQLTVLILENKMKLKPPFRHKVWCCQICGSENYLLNNNQSVKKIIIENFKTTNL